MRLMAKWAVLIVLPVLLGTGMLTTDAQASCKCKTCQCDVCKC